MSDDPKQEAPKVPPPDVARLILGLVLFGVLMATRDEFHSFWMRALLAGCAGGALVVFVLPLRKYWR